LEPGYLTPAPALTGQVQAAATTAAAAAGTTVVCMSGLDRAVCCCFCASHAVWHLLKAGTHMQRWRNHMLQQKICKAAHLWQPLQHPLQRLR
jgi:hypothetical protein